jgi:hypothetical protein
VTTSIGSETQKEMAQAGEFPSPPCDPDFHSWHPSIHRGQAPRRNTANAVPSRHKDLLDTGYRKDRMMRVQMIDAAADVNQSAIVSART